MKKIIVTALSLATLVSAVNASESPESIFDAKCAMCHSKTMPKDPSSVVAPALFGVMRHIKMTYPNKEDAVKFMVDYVMEPSKEKAICMPQKIARFGLMPSQKGNISKEELQQVAEWMFDNFPPANFRGRGMNMQQRPSFEDFDANGDGMISKEEFDAFRMKRMQSRMGR